MHIIQVYRYVIISIPVRKLSLWDTWMLFDPHLRNLTYGNQFLITIPDLDNSIMVHENVKQLMSVC